MAACSDFSTPQAPASGHEHAHPQGDTPLRQVAAFDGDWEAPEADAQRTGDTELSVRLQLARAFVPIAEGNQTEVVTINGSFPGPTIRARVGDTLSITVGNGLPHGTVSLHIPGLISLGAVNSTAPLDTVVGPNAERTLKFVADRAGTFLYLPSPYATKLTAADLVAQGLVGAVVVEDAKPIDVDRERVILLHDVLLDEDNSLKLNVDKIASLIGRQGNVPLVNGHPNPRADIAPGALERWRIVNASLARFYGLRASDRALQLVATDGTLVDRPRAMSSVRLSPGERIDILVRGSSAGSESATLVSEPIARGNGTGDQPAFDVLRVASAGSAVAEEKPVPEVLKPAAEFEVAPATSTLELRISDTVLTFSGDPAHAGEHGLPSDAERQPRPEIYINGAAHPLIKPMKAAPSARLDLQVVNTGEVSHSLHLGAGRMLVSMDDASGTSFKVWKDTVDFTRLQDPVTVPVLTREDVGTSAGWSGMVEHSMYGLMFDVRAP